MQAQNLINLPFRTHFSRTLQDVASRWSAPCGNRDKCNNKWEGNLERSQESTNNV